MDVMPIQSSIATLLWMVPMRYWLFKTNPSTEYDIDERLRHPEPRITWRVTRYAKEIEPGDVAFVWRCGRDPSRDRGICAVVEIEARPREMPEPALEQHFSIHGD